ncbi:LamB/YcsF family protein [Pseudomonas daroniae]|uniref:5-oxoprolinase subunit A n=1 Tax=Phytopseudomonas daroniae TaxID=2487519 RepID=A0A4Q9QMM5_9GAMM|nr:MULTISPECIES: 5-oxoprolinase subunit PxpA [Pseudomonas]TBU81036.1 LamB/YcsF family protein [Pseudomonas daroniae]TBU83561.1 LamB/YcsF family protein [Pseudomonas sp. FRB 228]TBU87478.1 LamB/YcsF family protein [Pseudomonas daroniae]
MKIDLNADLGEGFGPWKMGEDEALMALISSANVACGFHAGDPLIMDATVRRAKALGIDLGAHVGFPDLQGFGRRRMNIELKELCCMVIYQLGALSGIARAAGHRVSHMSFHGALGNMAAADAELAGPLVRAVASFDPGIIISSSSSQAIERAADKCGLRVATTFLADRAYDDDCLLVPRGTPGAVVSDHGQVMARIAQLLEDGTVTTITGKRVAVNARSILLHGDTPGAVDFARSIRASIERQGGLITPITQLLAGS